MANLNNAIRARIRNVAILDKFKPLEQAMLEREHALAEEIRQAAYGDIIKELEPLAEKYPKWFKFSDYVYIGMGYSGNFSFGKSVILTSNCGSEVEINDRALIDKARTFYDDEKELKVNKKAAERALDVMLSNFRTTKQVREGWPEGKPYWEPVIGAQDKANTLPAIRTEEVNALFGLPKESV